MSDIEHNDDTSPDSGTETVSIDHVQQAVESYRNMRKTREYVIPNPDGDDVVVEFEYRMLSETEREEMANKTASFTPTRSGQDSEVDLDISAGRLYAIKEAVTNTNIEGFKATDRGIKKATTPDIREDLGNAIEEFSEMPEEERIKFR